MHEINPLIEKNQISSNILKGFLKKHQEELKEYFPANMESESSDDDEPLNNKKAPTVMNFNRKL